MDEDCDERIIWCVQCHVETIVKWLGLDADGYRIKVRRMGGREYGCAEMLEQHAEQQRKAGLLAQQVQ